MEWPFWVGLAIFVGTVGGLLWMRNRPLRDARGNVVDEYGRPIDQLSSEANVVLITLRRSGEPLSGYDLRRHVDMTRQNFYAMIADLEFRKLIDNRVDEVGEHRIRRYFLSDEGHKLFNA